MSFWRPMDTAPMDGTEILLKTRRGIVSAWFCYEPGTPGSDDGAYDWICYDDEFQIEGHDSVIEAWVPIPTETMLICNNEFGYEDFCSLPKGHDGPCRHCSINT